MPRFLSLLVIALVLAFQGVPGATSPAWAQVLPPRTQWDRTLGGPDSDVARVVVPTRDGGYLLGGSSNSSVGPYKSQPRRGSDDYWVIKVNANGIPEWNATFGGAANSLNYLYDAQQTADGGFILGGYSTFGVGGDRTAPSSGAADYWLVKLDAAGTKQWDRAYGGPSEDYLTSLIQTTDGGYLLGGYSGSGVGGAKTQANRGVYDYWVVKVDGLGNKQWDRTYGGNPTNFSAACQLQRVRQTPDGGYILAGFTTDTEGGDQTQLSRGDADFWLVKLNAAGTKQWDRLLGGTGGDVLFGMELTPDGGYILAGTSDSGVGGEKSEPSRGTGDYWLVKTDALGRPQWDRTFGGSGYDDLNDVCLGFDGGYLLAGYSPSPASGDKTQPHLGRGDGWLVKVDEQGTKQWDRTLGGPEVDGMTRARATRDGGYILSAFSASGISADKSEPNLSLLVPYQDAWIIKLAPPQVRITGPVELCSGQPGQLLAVSTGAVPQALRWNTGATTAALPISQPGTYTVTATFAGGLTSTATLVVAPFSAVALIRGDTLLCPGRSVELTAVAAGATSLAWSTGATTPTLNVRQPGTYTLVATYASGCTSRAQVRVSPVPLVPVFALGNDTTLCQGTALLLQAAVPVGPGVAYRWSTGATTPKLLVTQPGTYRLDLSTSCDTRTASRVVAYRPCVDLPTIITPNGDQLNEQFVVRGLTGNWALQVFSRWGARVYATEVYRNEWGPNTAPGTYYYLLTQAGNPAVYKGWVEVVR